LETNFQFRGKPRSIKPFGGANKDSFLVLESLSESKHTYKALCQA